MQRRSGFFAAILAASLIGGLASAARADDSRAGEVQATISAQIDAFSHDDGAKAYSLAAPGIQMMFPSPDAFMAMVKGGYAPVYHPQQFQFSDFRAEGDRLVQAVDITASDGTSWIAEYTLSRAADGSLRIEACKLSKRPGVGA